MNMIDVVVNTSDDVFLAGLSRLILLSQEIKSRVGYYSHDERSEAILAVGRQVIKPNAFVGETLDVLEKAVDAEKDALEMIRHGFSHQNDWGMTCEEYYAFNTIVNRGVCQKLYEEYKKMAEREAESVEEVSLDGR